MDPKKENSSFRDPSGFVFRQGGTLLRQVCKVYQQHYDHLMNGGLYDDLVGEELLVSHEQVNIRGPEPLSAYRVIKPEEIPFISYPYEWCFGQLKDAALLTLRIQKMALAKGMVLKDANAFNIQFVGYRPVFIDTLSFEMYEEGSPWVAYKQFCEHFLAPLALARHKGPSLIRLLRVFLDGIPLQLASSLLPKSTFFDFSLLSHIHLHAKMQSAYAGKKQASHKRGLSKEKLLVLIDSLERAVRSLHWDPADTEWADYYDDTNYSNKAFEHKTELVESLIAERSPGTVWDMGANEGTFSRLTSEKNIRTISMDGDPAAVEKNYRVAVSRKDEQLLPLVMDITNESPSLGWHLRERMSLQERGPADMVIALALIHHLAITSNVPLDHLARYFSSIADTLVIEFVPKDDSNTMRLLASREDVFPEYTEEDFEEHFGRLFTVIRKTRIADSKRMLYVMERNHE